MSVTSIQDQGYTPPDFLQKLFRRNSTAASENTYKPLSSISNLNGNYNFSSLTNIPAHDPKSSPSKLLRAHSMNEDQRISTKKFKIFYSAAMEGVFPEVEMLDIWHRFEKSLTNPFEYDQLIDQIRDIKTKQKQSTAGSETKTQPVKISKCKKRSISEQKIDLKVSSSAENNKNRKYQSVCKLRNQAKIQQDNMKDTIKYIRGIIKHGQKFIKNR